MPKMFCGGKEWQYISFPFGHQTVIACKYRTTIKIYYMRRKVYN